MELAATLVPHPLRNLLLLIETSAIFHAQEMRVLLTGMKLVPILALFL